MAPYSIHESLLQVKDVSLALGGTPILRNVNAEVKNIRRPGHSQGQVVALLGPSGVGKTKLFEVLAGLRQPDSGTVTVTERALTVKAGMVGVVDQRSTLFPHRTVLGNLVLAALVKGTPKKEAEAKAIEYLKKFALVDKRSLYPAQLSGGQRQRVAIIQQLLSSEHFLLMDEPFSGLDPLMKDKACKLVAEVAAADELNTIVVTTHDIESAIAIADTLWLLGRDRDEKGTSLGARVQHVYDLAEMGLAWDPDIQSRQQFFEIAKEVKAKFASL